MEAFGHASAEGRRTGNDADLRRAADLLIAGDALAEWPGLAVDLDMAPEDGGPTGGHRLCESFARLAARAGGEGLSVTLRRTDDGGTAVRWTGSPAEPPEHWPEVRALASLGCRHVGVFVPEGWGRVGLSAQERAWLSRLRRAA